MKKIFSSAIALAFPLMLFAQGWPANYGGVMLQGFYWDSFEDSQWTTLEKQSDELSKYFSLIWIPQSGNCGGTSMGYNPKYYWDQNSTFGTEAQLRSMISTFKAKGLGTIADVVINHRQNLSNWVDFPAETYKGVTYQMVSTDICADDDDGKAKTWATANGYQLSSNKDSGEGWDGMRDLDHASENVQKSIFAYEDYLLNDLGYTGFRYDVAKGFAEKYFALYNAKAKPQFSVGEVWDSNQRIKTWIDKTKTDGTNTYDTPLSAAFDFQFRYRVRDAINNNNWGNLASSDCLIYDENYQRWAVTFVENHDTERRENDNQDPIVRDTLAANAAILAMPGTPCVFFKHWQKYKKEIKLMIEARRLAGIHNQSTYVNISKNTTQCAFLVTGTNGQFVVVVGPGASTYTRGGFKTLIKGYHYQYLVQESVDTSGWQAIVDYVNANTSEPEPEPAPVIPSCAVTQTGTYAYFEKPASWGSTLNVWAWHNDASHSNMYSGASWPGAVSRSDISVAGTNDATGNSVYLWKYSGTATPPAMIIFNDGSKQTADLTFVNGGYYTKDGLIGNVTDGIESITVSKKDCARYNLAGQRVSSNTKGLIIQSGKKILVK